MVNWIHWIRASDVTLLIREYTRWGGSAMVSSRSIRACSIYGRRNGFVALDIRTCFIRGLRGRNMM